MVSKVPTAAHVKTWRLPAPARLVHDGATGQVDDPPVIAPAWSDATKAAVSATSARHGSRPSAVPVIKACSASDSRSTGSGEVSGRGQEVGPCRLGDRLQDVVERHPDQRPVLYDVKADRVLGHLLEVGEGVRPAR
jgi:hypothetical protein